MDFLDAFQIENVTFASNDNQLVVAEVLFSVRKLIDDYEVRDDVRAKIRVKAAHNITIFELHELIYRAALASIQQVISVVDGKNVADLNVEALERAKGRRGSTV